MDLRFTTDLVNLAGDAELRLQRAEQKFEMLFTHSPVGMALIDSRTGCCIEVNPYFLDRIGYSKDELKKQSFWTLTTGSYRRAIKQIEDLNQTGRFGLNEVECIRKDGSRFYAKVSGFKLLDESGKELVWGIVEDISREKAMREELEKLALYDSLTGLANRRLFSETLRTDLEMCRRHSENLALFFIDFDDFKKVNDRHGHRLGDEVLKTVAQRLLDAARRGTDTVCRWGGDEFVLLMPGVESNDECLQQGHRLIELMAAPIKISDIEITQTFSVGVSLFPDHGCDESSLVSLADHAAYSVKRDGRNGVCIAS